MKHKTSQTQSLSGIQNSLLNLKGSENKLTPRQNQILQLIKSYITDTGYPPTRAEISTQLGFRSHNAAEEHLRALARKGFIEMIPGASRGIKLCNERPPGIPIVGNVAAGNPIFAEEHIEEYCTLNPNFFSPRADYFLRVRGDSMAGAGIDNGDLLAVHKTDQACDGQIIVARIDDEVTVKRLKRQPENSGAKLLLLPENELYSPIEVNLNTHSFAIEGISVGAIKQSIL